MKSSKVISLSLGIALLAGLGLAQVDSTNQTPSASSLQIMIDGNPVELDSFEPGTSYKIDGSTIMVSTGMADINVSAKQGMIQVGDGPLVIEATSLRIKERESSKVVFLASINGAGGTAPARGPQEDVSQEEAPRENGEVVESARLPDASTAPMPTMPVIPNPAPQAKEQPRTNNVQPNRPSGRVPQNREPRQSMPLNRYPQPRSR